MQLDLIKFIVEDCVKNNKKILKVGLVGSYARGDFNNDSDIDFVFHMNEKDEEDVMLDLGIRLENIFNTQFNKDVDIIIHDWIDRRQKKSTEPIEKFGYEQMKKDLVWLWECDGSLWDV